MMNVPLTAIPEEFTLGHLFDDARQRYQRMSSFGIGVAIPMMAFEVIPTVTDFSLNPAVVFRVSETPERMVMIGLDEDWGAYMMKMAEKVGKACEASGVVSHPDNRAENTRLLVPRRNLRLDRVYAAMRETKTSVLACSLPSGKKRVPFIAVVVLDGPEIVADMRKRMDLAHRKTLTFICPAVLSFSQ